MTFDGFISYSHAADGRLAPAVQRGLHRLAKPWHRRRALWIFRDQTGLAVTPGLWSSIQTALDGSEYFVLLASPEAARSPWVNREIEHWISTKSADRVLPVVTEGEWAWDNERGDFTEESTAVPPALRGVFREEPFFLDLRWARGSEHLSLHHSRFRDAIAQLAAPMHGVSKDELEGEDVRQHRRARRLRSGAAATLAVLAVLATLTGMSAVHNAERAKAAAAEALRQRQVADGQRDNAERSAAEARRQQQELARQQRARASQAAAEASQSEQVAREQQDAADRASAEARRQQDLADRATTRTQEQQKLAKEASDRAKAASDRAKRLQEEARHQAAVAAEQRRLADQAAAEAKAQQAKADQQQRIAISRRLMNQATATVGDDPATALRLGTAAQTLDPGAETRRQFSGVVTATHWAGTIGDASAAMFGADGVLATAGSGGLVSLWDVSRPWDPVRLSTLADTILGTHLEFSPDRRTLAFVNAAHQAVLWDVSRPSHPVRQSALVDSRFIRDVALSGDGITAATGDSTGAVSIWDITDRTRPARLLTLYHFEAQPVVNMTFSPNGRFLLVKHTSAAPVYDLTDRAHPASADTIPWGSARNVFTPDGRTLASGGSSGGFTLNNLISWNNSDPGPPMDPGEPYDPGEPSTPSTETPVKGRPPEIPTATSAATPSPTVDPSPTGPPSSLRAVHNDRVLGLASGTASTDTPQPPPPLPPIDEDDEEFWTQWLDGLSGTVTALAFAPSGTHVFAGDENGTVGMWDYQGWKLTRPKVAFTVHAHGTVNTISVDPKTGLLATSDISRTTTLWYVPPAGEPDARTVLAGPNGNPVGLSVSADGSSLIAANSGGTARVWNIHDVGHPVTGPLLTLRDIGYRQVAFSPDQRRVATFDDANTLRVADLARPDRTATLFTVPAPPGVQKGASFAFSPDGRTVAAVPDDDTTLMLWDVADLSHPVLRARVNSPGVGGPVAFSPDGRVLAVADNASIISLWNVSNRSAPVKLSTLIGHSQAISALAFSPDGRTLATGGSGGAPAILWDVSDPARAGRLASLPGAGSAAVALAFSADGRSLATVDPDNVIVVWDSSSPAEPIKLATIKVFSAGHVPVAFHGGDTLVVLAQPETVGSNVTLWDLGKLKSLRADPAKYACGVTGRGLDTVEWKRFIPELPYRPTCPR